MFLMNTITLICFLYFVAVQGLSPKPGAQIRINTAALNSAAKSLLEEFNALGDTIQIGDQEFGEHLIHGKISNIKVKKLTIDKNQMKIITNNDGTINLQCNSISVAISFHYKIKIGKKHFHVSKSGNCDTSISHSSAAIKLHIGANGAHPLINLVDKSADIHDFNYHCHGGFIDKVINLLKKFFKKPLQKEIKKFVVNEIEKIIPKVSQKLLALQIEHQLRGKLAGIFVNYGLNSSPILSNQMLKIPLIMQFWYKNHENDHPSSVYPSNQSFPNSAPPQMFCVNIDSNLALKSAIYAFNISDKSNFVIGDSIYKRLGESKKQFFDCNCAGKNCLVTQIPNLKKECLKDKKFGIHGIIKVGGDIYVNKSGIILFADGIFNFKLGNGDGYETGPTLLTINAKVDLLVEKTIHIQNWSLYGKLDVLSASLSANSTFGNIAPGVLNEIWNFVLKDIVELLANDALASGIPLPPLNFITFKNVHLQFDNPIIQFCSDVDFDFKKLLS